MRGSGIYTYYTNEEINKIALLRTNDHPIFRTGTKHMTKTHGDVVVLGRLAIMKQSPSEKFPRYPWFKVSFSDGTLRIVDRGALRRGDIKNPFTPNIYNVGFLGTGIFTCFDPTTGETTPEYAIWASMLQRCYSYRFHKNNPAYKDCSVDPRWHNFQNFCEDIQLLEGYAEWKADSLIKGKAKWELDKDIKVKGNKSYSQDTCLFVTAIANKLQRNLTGEIYKGIRVADGYTEEFTNQQAFAIKYELCSGHICSCLRGKKHTHKGWVFKIKEEQTSE